jgi:hypothetical protein
MKDMKANDELENFIRTNREAFDEKVPPSAVWDRISGRFPAKKNSGWWNNVTVWRAAAVIFMAMSVYFAIPKGTRVGDTDKLAAKEFGDVEAFYTRQISQKVELIEEISRGDVEDEFTQDFQQLEAMYLVLKEELKTRPSKKVNDALVLNLLVRINLLNQQLYRLEEELKGEEKTDEPAASA